MLIAICRARMYVVLRQLNTSNKIFEPQLRLYCLIKEILAKTQIALRVFLKTRVIELISNNGFSLFQLYKEVECPQRNPPVSLSPVSSPSRTETLLPASTAIPTSPRTFPCSSEQSPTRPQDTASAFSQPTLWE